MSSWVPALVAFVSYDLDERSRQYFSRVFAYIYRRTRDIQASEDLVLEVFERTPAMDRALRGESAFAIWLFTTARGLLISHRRRQDLSGSPFSQGAREPELLQRPEVARIMSHLCRFPLREQDVTALKFDAQLTDAQIAQVMKLPQGTVRRILYRALRKLRQALEQDSHSSSIAGSA